MTRHVWLFADFPMLLAFIFAATADELPDRRAGFATVLAAAGLCMLVISRGASSPWAFYLRGAVWGFAALAYAWNPMTHLQTLALAAAASVATICAWSFELRAQRAAA